MSARERILQKVRAALGGVAAPPAPPVADPVTVGDDAVAAFTARAIAVGAEVRTTSGDPAAVVRAVLQQGSADTVMLGSGRAAQRLAVSLRAAGLRVLPPDADRDGVFAADAGVTDAQWGIAETGSLALLSSAERARVASLVPPLHVALLPRARVLGSLDDLVRATPRPIARALTLITGPSRTADIELQLVVGVHGPRRLVIVLTDDQPVAEGAREPHS